MMLNFQRLKNHENIYLFKKKPFGCCNYDEYFKGNKKINN